LLAAVTKPKVCIYTPVDESGVSHRLIRAAGCEVVVGKLTRGIGINWDALMDIASGAHAPQSVLRTWIWKWLQVWE